MEINEEYILEQIAEIVENKVEAVFSSWNNEKWEATVGNFVFIAFQQIFKNHIDEFEDAIKSKAKECVENMSDFDIKGSRDSGYYKLSAYYQAIDEAVKEKSDFIKNGVKLQIERMINIGLQNAVFKALEKSDE